MLRPAVDALDQLVAPLSAGEHRVATALATLSDGWTVYVQPRIGLDLPDFIALHDRFGVCAIEVRDWQPGEVRRNEYGEFEFLVGPDDWQRSAEQPRFEASRYRSTIFDQFFAMPEDGGSPPCEIRAMLVLPNFTTDDAVELFSDGVDEDAEEPVGVWGGDVLDGIESAVRGADLDCAAPRPASMTRMRQHIVPSERVVVDAADAIPVSAGVIDIATNPLGLRSRRIRGAAGSGKTFGLTARAAQLAASSRRVLVLSFNVTLANRLQVLVTERCREIGANPTLVTCTNFHTLCTRIVQDAEVAGYVMNPPPGVPWTVAIVAKVEQAFDQGFQRSYDAVLIDEGQDYTLDWWNLLRRRVLTPDGEMLVVADPTQDLYRRVAWTERDGPGGARFSADWTHLHGTYRVPADLTTFVNDLAQRAGIAERLPLEPAADHAAITGDRATTSRRRWTDVERVNDLGRAVGLEVVRILQEYPELSPGDVAFLCEYHHDGVAAVRVIERAGYPVHHIFSRDPDAPRRRRKHRFWPGAPEVKGCTVHSFKGWESPVLVVGVGSDARADRAAFVALTRSVAPPDGGHAIVSIVNANRGLSSLRSEFTEGSPEAPPPIATAESPRSRPMTPIDSPAPFSQPEVFAPTAEHPLQPPASLDAAPAVRVAAPAVGYTPPIAPIPPPSTQPAITAGAASTGSPFAAPPGSPRVDGALAPPAPGAAATHGPPPAPMNAPAVEHDDALA